MTIVEEREKRSRWFVLLYFSYETKINISQYISTFNNTKSYA